MMKTPVTIMLALAVSISLLSIGSTHADDDAKNDSPTTASSTKPSATRPATTSRPARVGSKSPETKAAEDAIKAATIALTREAQDALKKPDGTLPRTGPDYFKEKDHKIDQATLLKAVSRSISRDPRVDAYVKLQLLSAVEKFDVEHAGDAINAYVSAPPLVPLPGMTPKELQQWDRRAATAKEADVPLINEEYQQLRARGEASNAPMIAYRNALKDRISVDEASKPRLLQAQVEELSQRAAVGLDTWKQWQALSGEIQTWAGGSSKTQINSMITFLKDYAKRTGPTVYEELTWSKRTKVPKADWKEHKAILDPKRMTSLIESLTKQMPNAL